MRNDPVVLIDTSLLLQHVRLRKVKNTPLLLSIAHYGTGVVSAVSTVEYNVGELVARRETNFQAEFPQLIRLPLTDNVLIRAQYLQADSVRQNRRMDFADLLIAATAVTHKLPLLTLNVAHFQHLAGISALRLRKVQS